jgi:hypothetical protein
MIQAKRETVQDGGLREPFRARTVWEAVRRYSWLLRTWQTFLLKHTVGKPGGESELFEHLAT